MPFWLGEAPGRTDELSAAVSRLRTDVASKLGDATETLNWLVNEVGIGHAPAEQLVEYLAAARLALGVMPSRETLVIERFFDESGGTQLVIHSPFGSRLNRAWGLALRKRFCRKFNFELQAAATEDAIVLSLSSSHSFPLEEIFAYLRSSSVRELLIQALLDAPMFTTRWRWNANRSLAIVRRQGGRKIAPQLQRMQAEDLLAAVFPDQVACGENLVGDREIPDHPLVKQTIRDCLEEAMDIEGLEALLKSIESDERTLIARDLTEPSPLALEILSARPYAYLDDAPLEERRTQAVMNRRWLDPETAGDLGVLDQDAIDRVKEEAWPQAESADELHDAMVQLGFITSEEGSAGGGSSWEGYLTGLIADRRAAVLVANERTFWIAVERLPHLLAVYADARLEPPITNDTVIAEHDEALVELLRGRLEALGPATARSLATSMGLTLPSIEAALIGLESEGFVMRGRFTPGRDETEWCVRRLLARIHRYTLNRLRKEIEPVSAADFMRFLISWQRLSPGHRVGDGAESLAAVIEQLEGFEAAAGAWEGELLPSRLEDYEPEWLDSLCLSGRFVWRVLVLLGRSGPVQFVPRRLLC